MPFQESRFQEDKNWYSAWDKSNVAQFGLRFRCLRTIDLAWALDKITERNYQDSLSFYKETFLIDLVCFMASQYLFGYFVTKSV